MQSVVKQGVVLGCLVLAFLPISAQRWVRVFESTAVGAAYIDAQSKVVDGGRIRYTGRQAGAPYQVIAICNPALRADGELPRQRETPAYEFVAKIDWMKSEVAAACNLPADVLQAPGSTGNHPVGRHASPVASDGNKSIR